jgi:hypothetical protein
MIAEQLGGAATGKSSAGGGGMNIEGFKKKAAEKAIGIGPMYMADKASHALSAFGNFMNGDNVRALSEASQAFPLLNWQATDLAANRLILDNAFQYMDPSAAYRVWLDQSKKAQKQGRPYMDATRPGAMASEHAPRVAGSKK